MIVYRLTEPCPKIFPLLAPSPAAMWHRLLVLLTLNEWILWHQGTSEESQDFFSSSEQKNKKRLFNSNFFGPTFFIWQRKGVKIFLQRKFSKKSSDRERFRASGHFLLVDGCQRWNDPRRKDLWHFSDLQKLPGSNLNERLKCFSEPEQGHKARASEFHVLFFCSFSAY